MTQVIIAPRVENPSSGTEPVVSGGWFQIRPSRGYFLNGQRVEAIFAVNATPLQGSPVTIDLDPLADIPYELYMNLPDGKGKRKEITEFRIITDVGSPTAWESFELVGGPGAPTAPPSDWEARIAAVESAISNLSGGASNLASITDMSAFMRTVNDDTSALAARTTLGAAQDTAVVTLAGTQTITGAKTVGTLTVSTAATVPTPTQAGHAVTKAYADALPGTGGSTATWAGITGKPSTFPPETPIAQASITGLPALVTQVNSLAQGVVWIREISAGVYPNRTITPQKVIWEGSVAPVIGGTVTSGTTAVNNLDGWVNTA